MEQLKKHIRHVPDFPKPGILFYDITTNAFQQPGHNVVTAVVGHHFQDVSIFYDGITNDGIVATLYGQFLWSVNGHIHLLKIMPIQQPSPGGVTADNRTVRIGRLFLV